QGFSTELSLANPEGPGNSDGPGRSAGCNGGLFSGVRRNLVNQSRDREGAVVIQAPAAHSRTYRKTTALSIHLVAPTLKSSQSSRATSPLAGATSQPETPGAADRTHVHLAHTNASPQGSRPSVAQCSKPASCSRDLSSHSPHAPKTS